MNCAIRDHTSDTVIQPMRADERLLVTHIYSAADDSLQGPFALRLRTNGTSEPIRTGEFVEDSSPPPSALTSRTQANLLSGGGGRMAYALNSVSFDLTAARSDGIERRRIGDDERSRSAYRLHVLPHFGVP